MDATRRLLLGGGLPSVAEAAEEARVSRATAYRYFPTQGALIHEAVKAVLVPASDWEELLAGGGDLAGRVERLVAKVFELTRDNEALLRGTLLLSLQQWAKTQAGEDLGEPPIERGGRLEGLQVALEPFEGALDADGLRRLAIAVSVFLGIESRIVMCDIWHLGDDEAEQVTLWTVRALAVAAIEQDDPGKPAPPRVCGGGPPG